MKLAPDEKFHTSEPIRVLGTIHTVDGLQVYMIPEADYDKYQRWMETHMTDMIHEGVTGEEA